MSTPEDWFRTHIPLPGYNAGKHWTDDHDKVGEGKDNQRLGVRIGCNLGLHSRFYYDRRVFLVLIIAFQGFFFAENLHGSSLRATVKGWVKVGCNMGSYS